MSNRTLRVAFGLIITAASTTSAYCAFETSQIVRQNYYMDLQAPELTRKAETATDHNDIAEL
jgi:hypothetical protein